MEFAKYKREYCCEHCGLIWFAETTIANSTDCKECGSNNRAQYGIYACDSMGYMYAYESIVSSLKERGREIHFDKEHPKNKSTKLKV